MYRGKYYDAASFGSNPEMALQAFMPAPERKRIKTVNITYLQLALRRFIIDDKKFV